MRQRKVFKGWRCVRVLREMMSPYIRRSMSYAQDAPTAMTADEATYVSYRAAIEQRSVRAARTGVSSGSPPCTPLSPSTPGLPAWYGPALGCCANGCVPRC